MLRTLSGALTRTGAYQGERRQFSHDDGHVIIVTIIAGKVASIEDHLEERHD